jgi:hypothetical protein
MKIGDMVYEIIDGPVKWISEQVLEFMGWLEAGKVALCRVVKTGQMMRIAVECLVSAGLVVSAVYGHAAGEVPGHPLVQRPIAAATIATSGSTLLAGLGHEGGSMPQRQQITWRASVSQERSRA